MHNIYNQNSHIAQGTSSVSQIGETFVPRSVNNQKSRDIHIDWVRVGKFLHFRDDTILREESSPDLLGNTSSFALLHIGVSDTIE